MPNQEPASALIFGNSSVRVDTQGLFRPYLKTFVQPFLPTRLTAPGSPRMSVNGNGIELEQIVHTHQTSCQSGWPSGLGELNPSPHS